MILAIIFLVIFAVFVGINMYLAVSLVKSPMIETNFAKHFKRNGLLVAGATISFLAASFGFYMWANASFDALHTVQLVLGEILFIGGLLIAINCFIFHYYGKNIPENIDKWLFRIQLIGFIVATFSIFIYSNGIAPCLEGHYPLPNGISFKEGLVTPEGGSPNIAFYALCILSGAILVYFICDHYMYKEYGKHGTLESTFFVAFPAGIIGARIAYVIGNWSKEFAGQPFWHVFAIWEGGLTILGGAIGGILVGVLFFIWRNKKLSIWFAIDLVLPTILIAQAIGRWGNFFNCEVHGLLVDDSGWKWLPEVLFNNAKYSSTSGAAPDGQVYVPLYLIECVTNLLGFFVLAHVFDKALHKYHEPGDIGCGYIIWYGMTRVLMEPLRSADYQMGDKGYWSWLWSMVYVIVGTLLIVVNHIVRLIIKKKKGTYVVQPYDKKLGLVSTIIIVLVSGALLAGGAYMMATNEFVTKVEYNGFNIGSMILVLGVSAFLTLGISLPILFGGLNKQNEAFNESEAN